MSVPELTDRGPCPLCRGTAATPHIAFPDIPVVRCDGCGFLYSQRIMTAAGLAEYYKHGFGSERQRLGQLVNSKINASFLRRLLGDPRGLSLLDVGGGYGYFMAACRDLYGMTVAGAEPSLQEAEFGRQSLGLDLRPTMLSEAGFPRAAFDVVAAYEVIEHVPDPPAFVAELSEYAKPGGHLLIMTDNFESAVVRRLGAGFPKWIPHTHVSHFAPETLERVLTGAGLTVVGRLSYTPWELTAKGVRARFSRSPTPAEAYRFADVVAGEMSRSYPLFALRKRLSPLWASATATSRLDGELMFVLAKKS